MSISDKEFANLWLDKTKTVIDIKKACEYSSDTSVYRRRDKLGLSNVKREKRVGLMPKGDKLEEWKKDYSSGMSWDELEEKYGAVRSTQYKWGFFYNVFRGKPNVIVDDLFSERLTYEELIKFFKDQSRIFKQIVDTRQELNVTIPSDVPVIISFSGDWHLGSEGVDYETFDEDLDFISSTPNLYVMIGGDAIDNFIQPSKIGPALDQQPIIFQRALLEGAISKIREKVICIGTGNHNWWTKQAAGFDDTAEFAKKMNILYTGHGGFLNLTVGNQLYRIFRIHKTKFNSSFNPTHSLKQMWRTGIKDFDIGVGEHGHVPHIEVFRGHGKKKAAIKIGTYKVYDTYAIANGFFGVEIRTPCVILYPDKWDIIAFEDMREAVAVLSGGF